MRAALAVVKIATAANNPPMKVVLLNDTSAHANWGCVATSSGLKALIAARWPKALFQAFPAERLAYKRISFFRSHLERQIFHSIMGEDDEVGRTRSLSRALTRFKFDVARLRDTDVLILNGEGMMHGRSGHLVRLLGILELARRLGCQVAVVNQSVDVDPASDKGALLARVYRGLDVVCVRDMDSLDLLNDMGVGNASLVPDAAFATPAPDADGIDAIVQSHGLPDRFVAMTGSSLLSKKDGSVFASVCCKVRQAFDLPVVIFASTRTDIRLYEFVRDLYDDVYVIDARTDYRDVVALLSRAEALIGGRFHPTIFAAIAGAPVLGFAGNTHKISGMLKMMDYSIGEVSWFDGEAQDKALVQLVSERSSLADHLKDSAQRVTRAFEATAAFDGLANDKVT